LFAATSDLLNVNTTFDVWFLYEPKSLIKLVEELGVDEEKIISLIVSHTTVAVKTVIGKRTIPELIRKRSEIE
jgi:hypothetical protein